MVFQHSAMQLLAWVLLAVALFASQAHCFVHPRTTALARRTLMHNRAISSRRLAWQQTHQRGVAPQQLGGDSASRGSGGLTSLENYFIRCQSCMMCYKVPEGLQHQSESRGFVCRVCSRKFVVNKSAIRPLPRGAALTDASDEDIRFVRNYLQEHQRAPGQLKCVPRSLEVANYPADWTVQDIVALFAEYGVTQAHFNTATKTVIVDITSKDGYDRALREMNNFFYLPGIKLTVRPCFDTSKPREFAPMQQRMRCSVCREEAASVSVGRTAFCLMDYNCSPHILQPPASSDLRVIDQALYAKQLKETEELWREAIAESMVQLIQQQEQVRAKEQENPLAMLDVPRYTPQTAGRHVPLRIPKKQSKKARTTTAGGDTEASDALNPYQRRPTRPQNILSANPGQEQAAAAASSGVAGFSEPSAAAEAPVVRGPSCPSCGSTQTRVLFFATNLEVARNETWGSKDAPGARKKCECEECGCEWMAED